MHKRAIKGSILLTLFAALLVGLPELDSEAKQSNVSLNSPKPKKIERDFIEIKIGDQEGFKLYIGRKRSQRVQGIIPIQGAAQESYLRVQPRRSDDAVIVETSLVVGHLEPADWCKDIDKLPNFHLSTDLLKRGDSKLIGAIGNINGAYATVRFGEQQVFNAQDDIVPEGQDPSGRPASGPPAGCCSCSGVTCCPNPGKCLDCGTCGRCCRSQ